MKTDDNGRSLPAEFQCHMRSHLDRRVSQSERVSALTNRAERVRKDLWWLEPDGNNAEEVAKDIATCISEVAMPWFTTHSDLEATLFEVEAERDCFNKFVLAAYLAKKLGKADLRDKYVRLAEDEGGRIGRFPDKEHWFLLSGR